VRESVEAKAVRYLGEGRLRIEYVVGGVVRATCRGGEVCELGLEAGEWWCSCPARVRCAHLVALELVVDGLSGRCPRGTADAPSSGRRSGTGAAPCRPAGGLRETVCVCGS
jgi:hypothetical protein